MEEKKEEEEMMTGITGTKEKIKTFTQQTSLQD